MEELKETFLGIIRKEKDEVSITKLIEYILNPGNTTPEIIEKVLIATQSHKDSADFVKLLKDVNYNFWNTSAENSYDINGQADIVMKTSKFWIIIENKINAQETGDQSDRYSEIEVTQGIPVKYIHLKPNYNYHKLKNDKFVEFYYDQLADILREIKFIDLKKQESYLFITDMINHIDRYLVGNSFNNWKHVKEENKIKISNNISNKLINALKNAFNIEDCDSDEYTVNFYEKFNCFQIWKNLWNSEDDIKSRKGIHYEITFRDLSLYELNYLCKKNVEAAFVIHNETKTENRIPFEYLKRETYLYDETYDLDSDESINITVEKIAKKMKELSEQNDSWIDDIVKNTRLG